MRYRRAVWLGLGIILLAGGVWFFFGRPSAKAQTQFETVPVERGRIVAKLVASGSLSPLVTVQVGSQVSGRISNLYADFNSVVKKGQVIAKIDPQIFEAAVEQAKANFLVAQANLTKAKVQAIEAQKQNARTKTLASKKLVAPADEDSASANAESAAAQVAAAEAALAQTRAALNQTKVNLAYTTIVSPINGVVISRNVDVGQTVAASLQAPTLFSIAEDLAKMQIHTSVAEADIGRVQPQMKVTFNVDAYPRENFTGLVSQIRNSPQTVQNVVTYDVVVDVENPQLRLKPGMTANVTFVYAESGEGLRVPNAALRFTPPASILNALGKKPAPNFSPSTQPTEQVHWRKLWILRGQTPTMVRVRVGISDGSFTQIVEGELAEGDLVITEANGAKSEIKTPPGVPQPPRGRGVMRHL